MFGKIAKYAPIAVLLGYAAVYGSKGWQYVTSDLQAFASDPIGKIQAKWQNWAIVIALGIALAILKKVKLPKEIKVILTILVWLFIGWQIALAIDPPRYSSGGGAMVAATRNRYANGGA